MSKTEVAFVRSDEAMFSEIGSDVVALHVARGECFALPDVAADVWKRLAQPITIADLCEGLTKAYEVDDDTCRRDVAELIDDMIKAGIASQVTG